MNPIADLPIPDRLRVDTILARRRESFRGRLAMGLAGLALLLGGGAAGWEAHGFALQDFSSGRWAASGARGSQTAGSQLGTATTAADAISAHRVYVVETAHPVEVAAAQEAHLIQWLSRRIGHPLAVPDLAGLGYVLMGGRLLPAGNEAAAQFMYEGGSGHRLTVYVRASGGSDTRFQFASSGSFSAFSWIDQGLGFAIVGALDRSDLLNIADTVYQQVDPQHRPAPAEL